MRIKALLMIILVSGLIVSATNVEAEIKPGVRIGAYFDPTDAFIGGEVLANITDRWYFNPNLEYVFVDNAKFVTFNFDVHYDFASTEDLYFWIGGGPAILWFDPDAPRFANDTDFGVNVFAGLGFRTHSRIVPYIQPKLFISDDSEFSIAFGVRF